MLEGRIRARVRAIPNVRLVDRCDILGLATTPDDRRVTGARVLRRADGSAEQLLGADLVVDATGRGSRTPMWLEALGHPRPREEQVRIGLGYASRTYRLPPDALGGDVAVLQAATPEHPRTGGLQLLEGDRWMVTLGGILGDHPPTDPDGFLEFARSLRFPDIFETVRDAEPLDEPVAFRFPASVRRRYERLRRFPDGLLVLGDAVASFNPVYGQGMSVAALEALALRRHLERGTRPQPRRFFADLARVVDVPWEIAAGGDLVFPGVQGRRTPKGRLLNAYIARLHAAAARDAGLADAFVRVAGLVALPRPSCIPGSRFACCGRAGSRRAASGRRAWWRGRHPAHRWGPFPAQDGIHQVAGPFALGPGALQEMALTAHAGPLQHGGRAQVAVVAGRADPVLGPLDEQVAAAGGPPRSRSRPWCSAARVKPISAWCGSSARTGGAVADQPVGRLQGHGELEPLAGRVGMGGLQLGQEPARLAGPVGRLPALVAGDLWVGPVGDEGVQVLLPEPAQHEPRRGQRREPDISHRPPPSPPDHARAVTGHRGRFGAMPPFYADLHIHSKFSRACSRDCDLEHLALVGRRKGISVIGTGDFTHPKWFEELESTLVPAEPGLFRLREDVERSVEARLPASCRGPVRFMLSVEISTIYKRAERTRKVHHLLYMPDLASAARCTAALKRIGNLASDGRPILGLDSRDLLEITLESGEGAYLVPAHAWTPWFSPLGSKSGFDRVEDCYADLADHIFALETGLSADPEMCWRVSGLDRYRLVSNSDAHSPPALGREATVLDTELDYWAIRRALETGQGFEGTVEFFPEEGKYHLDGHRKCGVRMEPAETRRHGGRCPVCGKPPTVGVLHRVEELADRPPGARPAGAAGFRNVIQLPELVGEVLGVGPRSKAVTAVVDGLVDRLGPELEILERVPTDEIAKAGPPLVAEAIARVRRGAVIRDAGYDGEYGTIRVFAPDELRSTPATEVLFDLTPSPDPGAHPDPGPPRPRPRRSPTAGAAPGGDAP